MITHHRHDQDQCHRDQQDIIDEKQEMPRNTPFQESVQSFASQHCCEQHDEATSIR